MRSGRRGYIKSTKYKSRLDAAMGAALMVHGLIAMTAGFLTLFLIVWELQTYPIRSVFEIPMLPASALFLVVVGVGFFFIRDVLIRGKATLWHWSGYFGLAFFALFLSTGFWGSTMHDLALIFFDSHGRFGCRAFGAGYIVTSATMPSVTFLTEPLFIAVCLVTRLFPTFRRGDGDD